MSTPRRDLYNVTKIEQKNESFVYSSLQHKFIQLKTGRKYKFRTLKMNLNQVNLKFKVRFGSGEPYILVKPDLALTV